MTKCQMTHIWKSSILQLVRLISTVNVPRKKHVQIFKIFFCLVNQCRLYKIDIDYALNVLNWPAVCGTNPIVPGFAVKHLNCKWHIIDSLTSTNWSVNLTLTNPWIMASDEFFYRIILGFANEHLYPTHCKIRRRYYFNCWR